VSGIRGKSQRTLDTEAAIVEIVEERSPITVRGVCYALFTRGLIDSMATKETGRISRIMTDMRESDDLDWESIVDDSRTVSRYSTWASASARIQDAANNYWRDNWQDQPHIVEVWSEKGTVGGILEPILNRYMVPFRVMKGFGSFTSLKRASADADDINLDQQPVALYIGDYDPSGLYMSEVDIPARLDRYSAEYLNTWEFRRIALTREDTAALPSFPAADKRNDGRHGWFVQNYGTRCWELDAMDPNDLRKRVESEIVGLLDMGQWEHAKRIQTAERASMMEFHAAWEARLKEGKS
jgi:hypothetical protein